MTTNWPDEERRVEVAPPEDDDAIDLSDPETRDAELEAEEPLELSEDQLRPDGPDEDDVTP